VPPLIKDTKAHCFILLLGVIRFTKPKLNSEQEAENILVARRIANAMLAAVVTIN
jgi:hypothetical protein